MSWSTELINNGISIGFWMIEFFESTSGLYILVVRAFKIYLVPAM